ncbi:MAG: GrpB family protein [Chloroflexota bacterium]|nr:GrpB family protein [Chloroflexota bacterium]MDE2942199.1 GrpB family protein [Chloroflexota bacterium]MDE3267500.1 GrpB family protein [Chloroflexota bacterium]
MDNWHSLGTAGEHIEVVEYRADWPLVFEREAAAILAACRPWITEGHHIGSTSVPGLAAKPILDVLPVAAGPAKADEAVSRMAALGYRYRGENGIVGRFYFDRVVDGRTVMHVHMFPAGHPEVHRHLVFRDHLRANPDAAREYERLKRELAARYRDDRRAYTDAKAAFITSVIDAAMRDA